MWKSIPIDFFCSSLLKIKRIAAIVSADPVMFDLTDELKLVLVAESPNMIPILNTIGQGN